MCWAEKKKKSEEAKHVARNKKGIRKNGNNVCRKEAGGERNERRGENVVKACRWTTRR